jgi:predicted ATPase
MDERVVWQSLIDLVQAELLYQRGSFPDATFTFKHALIQEMAYEAMLRKTRQQHHRRVAETLIERFPETVETQPELLAHHFTEAGLTEQAIGYWHKAGQCAIQRAANLEAINHLNKGLVLLNALPETLMRNEQELLLLTTLGPAVQVTKGPASPEMGHVYDRARELCQQVEDSPQLFSVLAGLRSFYNMRGELRIARELGEQILSLATQHDDSAVLVGSHRSLGHTLVFLGEFVAARHHFEQGIMLYNSQPHSLHAIQAQDGGVSCLCWLARSLWILGYASQALQRSQEALDLARNLSQPFNLAYALSNLAFMHLFRREHDHTKEVAEATIAISKEHEFVQYATTGMFWQGWALSVQSREKGLSSLHQALTAYRSIGMQAGLPVHLAVMAEVYGHTGQVEEGLTAITQALDLVDSTDERWWEAELNRLKGELLLQQSSDNHTEAETCFHQALSIARAQQAKSWELRAATSLARLWQSQGKRQDAYELLQPVYGWFTEGFDTADLKDAKALLEELG